MPDQATVEVRPPPKPEFKSSEVLAYGGEAKGTSAEQQKAQDRAKQLRDLKENGATGKQRFEAYSNSGESRNATFSRQDAETLTSRFGRGETKRNPDGRITAPEQEDAKASFEEAKPTIERISSYLEYAQIQIEAQRTGKSPDQILREKRPQNGLRPQEKWGDIRKKGLDAVLNEPVLEQMFPELKTITDPEAKTDYIEATLAADPKLQAKVAEKMADILERSKNLPQKPVDKDLEETRKTKESAGQRIGQGAETINQILNDANLPVTPELSSRVQKLIQEGKSIDAAINYLRTNIINTANIPELDSIVEYLTLKQSLPALEAKYADYTARRVSAELVNKAKEDYQRAVEHMREFDEKRRNDPNLQRQYTLFRRADQLLDAQKDQQSGIYLSPISDELDSMAKAKKGLDEAERTTASKEPEVTTQNNNWDMERLRQEADLLRDLEGVLPESIAEVMMDRHDEMAQVETKRLEQEAQKAEEQNKQEVAKGIKALGKAKDKWWIEYNETTRKKEVHRSQIGKDIRFVTYRGEEGFKRIAARALDFKIKDANGKEVSFNWQNGDFSTLSKEQQQILEEVYNSEGEALKQRLFADFRMAQSFSDVTLLGEPMGELALKDHEWAMLGENFGEMLSSSLDKSPQAKQLVKELEEKGIKRKSKPWLLFILALLGLAVGGAVNMTKEAARGDYGRPGI